MSTRPITRSFLQLASSTPRSAIRGVAKTGSSMRSAHNINTPLSVPEFLAPHSRAFSSRILRSKTSKNGIVIPAKVSGRQFSTTGSRKATVVTFNPRKNDDGTEQKIEITSNAAKRLQVLREKENNPNLALRVEVSSGGCHGLQYKMSLCDIPASIPRDIFQKPSEKSSQASSPDSNAMPSSTSASSPEPTENPTLDLDEDDVVFAYIDSQANANVVMDVESLKTLRGSKIDYETKLIGAEFKIVDNPAAMSSCGCGSSFDVKF